MDNLVFSAIHTLNDDDVGDSAGNNDVHHCGVQQGSGNQDYRSVQFMVFKYAGSEGVRRGEHRRAFLVQRVKNRALSG